MMATVIATPQALHYFPVRFEIFTKRIIILINMDINGSSLVWICLLPV